jgi:integrase
VAKLLTIPLASRVRGRARASLVEAKEILGHSQISVTANRYTHIYDRAKREAMDHMDAVLA